MSSINDKKNLTGRKYWRSLDDLAGKPEFDRWLHREFPQGAAEWDNRWSRRNFLTLMGASLALAGLAGCRRPEEKIVPYVKAPEEVLPGIPLHYATTMPNGSSPIGLLVESHEGRPTKIEGNSKHPSSLGGTTAQMQASILDLYDPDRSQFVQNSGTQSSWAEFTAFWRERFVEFQDTGGEGLAVLSEPFSSPTMARLKRRFEKQFPRARWVAWEPVSDENIHAGYAAATGKNVRPIFNYDKARVILSLDADFLLTETDSVRATKGFSSGRHIESEKDNMNRLYVVEPLFTITGANADHRLRLSSGEVGAFALALAGELQKQGLSIPGLDDMTIPEAPAGGAAWLTPLAKDLIQARGASLVVAGRRQPQAVQVLAAAINEALENLGATVTLVKNDDTLLSKHEDFARLTSAMAAGEISTLVMLGVNPAYNAPADIDFKTARRNVTHTIHVGSHVDESAEDVEWHVPRAHFLETWGDARSADGTLSVVQPLIEPLFNAKGDAEIAAVLATGEDLRGYDIVRETWKQYLRGSFENQWRTVLHEGLLAGSEPEPEKTGLRSGEVASTLKAHSFAAAAPGPSDLEVVFHPCNTVGAGTRANNGWLQELPDPISKLAWDNAATMSIKTARELGVKNEQLITVGYDGRELTLPVWIVPGQAHHTIGLALGYGRTSAGRVGNGVGFDTYRLRSSSADFARGASVAKTDGRHALATTQDHGAMEGRPIVREATLEEYRKHPEFAREAVEVPEFPESFRKKSDRVVTEYPSSWEEPSYAKGYQWGMSIDLTTCTGCNACTLACQSENNIPVVGKEQTRNGREMHWIRVDRYFTGDVDEPQAVHQAMPCQHCENAPCEQVCPVAATVHDSEGLNVMVYNRCIGTRYCSNNCPYKVRRFNFFNYTNEYPDIVKMAQNPDVTVRSRGVMEKCSYCIQRINRARHTAKVEKRDIREGDVITACQQACPADAIAFGDINNPDSKVVKVKKRNRDYALLGELNTQPRTTYLAKVRNPNPEIKTPGTGSFEVH